jgi:hypothetical protein
MATMSKLENFFQVEAKTLISGAVGVASVNALVGRSYMSKETMIGIVEYLVSYMVYSSFFRAWVEPYLLNGQFRGILSELMEVLAVSALIYTSERYIRGRQVELMQLFLETFAASSISDRLAVVM